MMSNRKPWRIVVPVIVLAFGVQAGWAMKNVGAAWKRSYQEAEAEARRLDRPLLLHFGATWCGPCKQMEAHVLSSPEVRRVLKDSVVGVKIDIDENPAIAQLYGVDSVPADVIISPTGKILVAKTVGGVTREAYVAKLLGAGQTYLASRATTPAPVAKSNAAPPNPPSNPVPPSNKVPESQKTLVVAMDGYCPVTLWRTREWVKGTTKYGADFQGVRFYFKTLEDRNDFIAQPARYAPQLLGCDPVLLQETERAIAGTPKHAAYFDGDLYLFAGANHRDRFKSSPEKFIQTRHVNLDEVEHNDTRLGLNR